MYCFVLVYIPGKLNSAHISSELLDGIYEYMECISRNHMINIIICLTTNSVIFYWWPVKQDVWIAYSMGKFLTLEGPGEGVDSTPHPYGFLPFTQKIFLRTIPEISWLFPTFVADTPINFFWQHFWDTQYKNIFLLFGLIKKIFLQPIPEISWLFPTFGCGYPYEIFFSENFVNTLWQHFWDTQYKFFVFVFCFNQKNLFTKPSWNNF